MGRILGSIRAISRFLRWTLRPAAFFLLSFSTAYAAGWVSTMPADWPDQDLCQVLLDRLSHTDPLCLETAIDEYPGFKSPPWQRLDASQYIDLITKLVRYRGAPPTNQDLSGRLQEANGFVKAGGTLKVWQTQLLTFFDGSAQFPVPAGDQTVVLLSRKYGSYCPTHPSVSQNDTFVVLPDLSGPDLRVTQGTAYELAISYPVLYKEKTLFVSYAVSSVRKGQISDGSSITIYRFVKETGAHTNVCEFWYNGNNQNSEVK